MYITWSEYDSLEVAKKLHKVEHTLKLHKIKCEHKNPNVSSYLINIILINIKL